MSTTVASPTAPAISRAGGFPRALGLAIGFLLLLSTSTGAGHANNAPIFESPQGLAPGHPNHRVRLVSEFVDIEVVERLGAVVERQVDRKTVTVFDEDVEAVVVSVNATFDLLNEGPDIDMLVGFPGDTGATSPDIPYQPIRALPLAVVPGPLPWSRFGRNTLSGFRVWTEETELQAEWREVGNAGGPLSPGIDDKWLVWSMRFPNAAPVRVHVAYHYQVEPGTYGPTRGLEDRESFPSGEEARGSALFTTVPVTYVLKSGALWHGTIGAATVRIRAAQGDLLAGASLLGTYPGDLGYPFSARSQSTHPSEWLHATVADERSPNEVVWRLQEFEPTVNVRADYLPRRRANRLRQAVEVASRPEATADELAASVHTALDVVAYVPVVLGWAERAVAIAPDGASAWLALARARRNAAWIPVDITADINSDQACEPDHIVEAYARSAALGSAPGARIYAELLGSRQLWLAQRKRDNPDLTFDPDPGTCPPTVPTAVALHPVVAARGLTAALGPGGIPHNLAHRFGGELLTRLVEEVNALRARGAYRQVALVESEIHEFRPTGATTAEVTTREAWRDRTIEGDGTVSRDDSRRVFRRYSLALGRLAFDPGLLDAPRSEFCWSKGRLDKDCQSGVTWDPRIVAIDEWPDAAAGPVVGPYGPLWPERPSVNTLHWRTSPTGDTDVMWDRDGFTIRRLADDTIITSIATPIDHNSILDSGANRRLVDVVRRKDGDSAGLLHTADGRRILTLSPEPRELKLWRVADGALEATVPGGLDAVTSRDGSLVATIDNGEVRVWRMLSGQLLRTARIASSRLMAGEFSPDGAVLTLRLATGNWRSRTETALFLRINDGAVHSTTRAHDWQFSADGRLIGWHTSPPSSTGWTPPQIFDLVSWSPILASDSLSYWLFGASPPTLVTRSEAGGVLRVWRWSRGQLERIIEVPSVVSSALSPDGARISVVDNKGTIATYRLDDGHREWEYATGISGGIKLAYGAADRTLLAFVPLRSPPAGGSHTVKGTLWLLQADNGAPMAVIGRTIDHALSADRQRVVVATSEILGLTPTIYNLWRLDDGTLLESSPLWPELLPQRWR